MYVVELDVDDVFDSVAEVAPGRRADEGITASSIGPSSADASFRIRRENFTLPVLLAL
jgi:hypothetical protein